MELVISVFLTLGFVACCHSADINEINTLFDGPYTVGALADHYWISKEMKTRNESRESCTAYGGRLVMFKNNQEYFEFIDFGKQHWPSDAIYLIWVDFKVYLDGTYKFAWEEEDFAADVWGSEQPDTSCNEGKSYFTPEGCQARIKLNSGEYIGLGDRKFEDDFLYLCEHLHVTNDCQHTWNESTYQCECRVGFDLSTDGKSCQDVVECDLTPSPCSGLCHNTEGSFTCTCEQGYVLQDDNSTCEDVDECEENIAPLCEQLCLNTVGSFVCSCNHGYRLKDDGSSCKNIDECAENQDLCEHNCTDSAGSFTCSCVNGYELLADNNSCANIDECAKNKDLCQNNCTDSIGSFACSCLDGYNLQSDSKSCVNVDECLDDRHQCNHLCNDTVGSYTCSCRQGFQLQSDGTTCVNVDECYEDIHDCDHLCNDTIGSYHCFCRDGYELLTDNRTCNLTDPCTYMFCSQTCTRTNDAEAVCECLDGYVLDLDLKTCTDINECDEREDLCTNEHSRCVNTEGSFRCDCHMDYTLQDGRCVQSQRQFVCPCSCRQKRTDLSRTEIEDLTDAIEEELVVDVQGLSSHVREKTSAPDERVSAQATGHVAVAFMVVVGLIIVIPDVSRAVTFLCWLLSRRHGRSGVQPRVP